MFNFCPGHVISEDFLKHSKYHYKLHNQLNVHALSQNTRAKTLLFNIFLIFYLERRVPSLHVLLVEVNSLVVVGLGGRGLGGGRPQDDLVEGRADSWLWHQGQALDPGEVWEDGEGHLVLGFRDPDWFETFLKTF